MPTVETSGERSVIFESANMVEAMKTFKVVSTATGSTREASYD